MRNYHVYATDKNVKIKFISGSENDVKDTLNKHTGKDYTLRGCPSKI
jgi:hypothetical protein